LIPDLADVLSDPEEARIPVPDPRFDWLCETYKPASKVPAFLTCIDIAGLTAGASTGAGLGNAFLSHVRAVDGIFQVVRAFDDAEVIHVEGDVDPLRDMQIISTELRLKDIEWVEKEIEKNKKNSRNLGNVSLADKAKKEEAVSQQSGCGTSRC
jgi:obg-like ATPase 1